MASFASMCHVEFVVRRNKWVFDGVAHPPYVIKEHILQTLLDWMRALGNLHSMSFLDFIDSLFVIEFFEKG